MFDLSGTMADGFTRGTQLLRASRYDQALVEFSNVHADAEARHDIDLIAACLCEMGWCCYKLGRAEDALQHAMSAQRLRATNDYRVGLARALSVEAVIFLDLGFTDEAFDLAERAVLLAEADGDGALLTFALNAKAIVLAICHEPDLGIALLERAVALAAVQDDQAAQAYYLLNLGFCHARSAENADSPDAAIASREQAIGFFTEAIRLSELCASHWTTRVALGNAAEMHALLGRYAAAEACLARSAAVPGEPGDSLRIHHLYALSEILLRVGDLHRARSVALEALAMADAAQQVDHQVNTLARLAEIHEKLGDIASALDTYKRYHAAYVLQSGVTARRRVRIEEIRSESVRLRSEAATLSSQALSDALTGIGNRRSFDQILNRLAGTPISLAIVDLDNFKQVNDRFSHIVGDAVLQRVARLIVDQIGAHGHAVRLGGEEFAVIFPDAPEATAAAMCEGIRYRISASDWSDLAPALAVTVSIGLAAGDGSIPTGDLMQSADRRLYIAKTNGRDRVIAGDTLLVLANATSIDATGLSA